MMVALLVAASTTAQAQLKREYSKPAASPVFSTTASPDIPMSVNFAGETVSFDRLDMAERRPSCASSVPTAIFPPWPRY